MACSGRWKPDCTIRQGNRRGFARREGDEKTLLYQSCTFWPSSPQQAKRPMWLPSLSSLWTDIPIFPALSSTCESNAQSSAHLALKFNACDVIMWCWRGLVVDKRPCSSQYHVLKRQGISKWIYGPRSWNCRSWFLPPSHRPPHCLLADPTPTALLTKDALSNTWYGNGLEPLLHCPCPGDEGLTPHLTHRTPLCFWCLCWPVHTLASNQNFFLLL